MQFEYEVFMGDDVISVFYHNETTEDISMTTFWMWIKKKEYDEWTIDYFDPVEHDGHRQESGRFSMEQYFSQPYETIKKDIKEYLSLKNKKP